MITTLSDAFKNTTSFFNAYYSILLFAVYGPTTIVFVDNCPYELEIPRLLKENYEDYQNVLNGKTKGVRNETMH